MVGSNLTAFLDRERLVSGSPHVVATEAKRALERGGPAALLVFDDSTGRVIDLDLSGTEAEVAARYPTPAAAGSSAGSAPDGMAPDGVEQDDAAPPAKRGRGRPRLGVVSREVTLLPRHWDWLRSQRGGASATLRRLVDRARTETAGTDSVRRAQDAAYRFLTAMVGNEPGFEEAMRALFAADEDRFVAESEAWPEDLRDYGRALATPAFASKTG